MTHTPEQIAEIAELREALEWYQDQMCEGFCADLPSADTFNDEMLEQCAGCKARATLSTQEKAHD